MTDTLETLAAKQAVTEGLHRYCHTVDENDRDGIAAVWHPDGTAEYEGWFEGSAADLADRLLSAHAPASRLSHQVTNVLVEVDGDGDRATSVCSVTAFVRMPGTDFVTRTRYHDTWSRRDGRWTIDHRRAEAPALQTMPNDSGPA